MDVYDWSISKMAARLQRQELTATQVTEAFLSRIATFDTHVGAYWTVCAEHALKQARAADKMLQSGQKTHQLCGIPVAVKDTIDTRNVPTSYGTESLRDWRPDRDAAVIERLHDAGCVLLGKLATYEFAISQHPNMHPPVNPWGWCYWAGGSSNGSGAALAARLCVGAIGTDTVGSIRVPSAICGVTGLKPTFGRVSRFGVHPLADTLDTVGPMARSAEDVAILFEAIAAPDDRDAGSIADAGVRAIDRAATMHNVRIGIDRSQISMLDPVILGPLDAALEVFADAGATICEVKLPDLSELGGQKLSTLLSVEAAYAQPGLTEDNRGLFGQGLQAIVAAGRAAKALEYFEVELSRRRFRAELNALLRSVDVLAMPVVPWPDITETSMQDGHASSDIVLQIMRLNAPFNMAGNPSLSLPGGFSAAGLPLGFQLIGKAGEDERLLELGMAYQKLTDWHQRTPRDADAVRAEAV